MVAVYGYKQTENTRSREVLLGSASMWHARGGSRDVDPDIVLENFKPASTPESTPIGVVHQNHNALDHYFLMAVVRSFGGQISVSYPEMDEAIYGQMALVHEKTDAGLYIARVTGDPRNEG